MAATGYTPIRLYNSTTALAVPLAANLAAGELALNITDGKLYYNDGGTVKLLASNGCIKPCNLISDLSRWLDPIYGYNWRGNPCRYAEHLFWRYWTYFVHRW